MCQSADFVIHCQEHFCFFCFFCSILKCEQRGDETLRKNAIPEREPASLSERAYATLREKILRGEIPAGAALSRRKLAVEYGMSFLPVSEALQRLEQDGLVESRPRVGTRVRVPTAYDIRDCYILREALECQAARLFAEKASSRERDELRRMAAQLDKMLFRAFSRPSKSDGQYDAGSYHVAFHLRVAECAGSAALSEALRKAHILTFNWLVDVSARFMNPPGRHQELMKALCGDSPAVAERAMRRHICYGLEKIQAAIVARYSPELRTVGGASSPAYAPPFSGNRKGTWRVKRDSGEPRPRRFPGKL